MGNNIKRIVVILICLILFLEFHFYLETLFNLVIGGRPFSSKLYLDIIFTIFWILGLIEIYNKVKVRYNPSFDQIVFFGGLCFIHSYYRFNDDWEFIRFQNDYSIAYLDIAYLPITFLIRYIINWVYSENKQQPQDDFIEDSEISLELEDKLNRHPFAEKIASKILAQKFEKSFSIGLVGQWGSGKSSFMKMINEKIKTNGQKVIIVSFNPFYNNSSDDIINEYFTILSKELAKYSGKLHNAINKYKDLLLLFAKEKEKGIVEKLNSVFTENLKSIQSKYDEINSVLRVIDIRIVVFIDDLDRLRPSEIIQILKLIRNTGDFYNTVYLVTYDKDYLLNALKEYAGYDDSSFSQKYFQYEFLLPAIDVQLLKDRFRVLTKDLLSDENYKEVDKSEYIPIISLEHDAFEENIHTFRDVTRLANTLKMELSFVHGEVGIPNFIDLMILKTKFSSAYKLLSMFPKRYLKPYSGFFGNYHEAFTLEKVKNEVKNEIKIIHELKQAPYAYNELEIEKVQKLLLGLFPENLDLNDGSNLLIRHPKNFDTYFSLRLMSGMLSEREFVTAFNSTFEDFRTQLNSWIDEVRFSQIVNRISVQTIENETQLKNIVGAVFYLGRRLEDKTIDAKIDRNELANILLKIEIDFDCDIPELIKKGFLEASAPYWFEFVIIWALFKRESFESWHVDHEYLKNKAKELYQSYLDNLDSINWHVYRLYHYVFDLGCQEFANESIKEFIKEKGQQKFLSDIIDRDAFEKRYVPSSILQKMFPDESFNTFLSEFSDSPQLGEFKKFFRLFELLGGDYAKHFFFDFKKIPLREYSNEPHITTEVIELFIWGDDMIYSYFISEKDSIMKQNDKIHIQLLKENHIAIRSYKDIDHDAFKSIVYDIFKSIELVNVGGKLKGKFDFKENETMLLDDEDVEKACVFLFQSGKF